VGQDHQNSAFVPSHRRTAPGVIVVYCVAASSACSLSVDAERVQCLTDLDCTKGNRGLSAGVCVESLCEVAPEWSCLLGREATRAEDAATASDGALDATAPEVPASPLAEPTLVDVSLPILDMPGLTPAIGLAARLCRKLDVDCAAPLAEINDSEGAFSFSVESPFEGYLRIDAPERLPVMYFLNPPLRDGEALPPVSLMDEASMGDLMQGLDIELSPEHGIAVLTTEDCLGGYSPGVVYETSSADMLTRTFYALDGLPSASVAQTDASGYGGFVNLPSGSVSVSGRLSTSEQPLATISLLIRPGVISYGRVAPPLRPPLL
jgi:hypothetical protein